MGLSSPELAGREYISVIGESVLESLWGCQRSHLKFTLFLQVEFDRIVTQWSLLL